VGDSKEVKKELSLLLPGETITPKAGSIVISGNHVKTIKTWLVRLGF